MQLISLRRNRNSSEHIPHYLPGVFILGLLLFCPACSKREATKEASVDLELSGSETINVRGTESQTFFASLPKGLAIPIESDEVGKRLLAEYGAVFVTRSGAVPPPTIIFTDDAVVSSWQAGVRTMRANFGGIDIELQTPAMTALMEARSEARIAKLDITPRDSDAARRSYAETVSLWQSRVNPGLVHWVREGRLTEQEAARIRALPLSDQISEILSLETKGIYFSRDLSKSILNSVAAPGASQHLSMLAFDVKENDDATIRTILAQPWASSGPTTYSRTGPRRRSSFSSSRDALIGTCRFDHRGVAECYWRSI
jgi:hypothetical protein